MQQQGSEYAGVSPEMLSFGSTGRAQMLAGGGGSEQAEAASPISSRPPASINFDELGDDPDRAGGSGGISSGNRWPRPETLALLKIRSEMDIAFRDATLKGPLWDEVSRKLAELGYVRSAKKCKEKFENVHKYYKRTKEGRAGRQDGKSYRFFTQLEALQGATAAAPTSTGSGGLNLVTSTATPAIPTAAGSVENIQFANPVSVGMVGGLPSGAVPSFQPFTVYPSAATAVPGSGAQPVPAAPGVGISFSSDSASSGSYGSDEDEEEFDDMSEEDLERPGPNPAGGAQKRKRGGGGGKRRMMDFFEGLMKQVMQKQEAMQQRFLEIIEKREQDRMMREEIWKRQEAARLSREQELAAHDRAIAASRDAAIVSFLQKITGQSIQLPQPVYTAPPSAPAIPPPAATPASPCRQQFHQQAQRHPSQNTELIGQHQMPPPSSDVIMAIPERQIPPQDAQTGGGGGGGSSSEAASSRWPKTEVLALIKLRSNLENRYQEAGPKGPLWEEISAGMQQMGYARSSKRCKEKWENINKYFKKVKESNKKRPEDAKTCPYFDELDALYQRKRLNIGSTRPFQQGLPGTTMDQETPVSNTETDAVEPNNGGGVGGLGDSIFGDEGSNAGGSRKPEDIMKEEQHELNSEKMDELGESTDKNEEEDEYRKMGYKIEFQSSNKNGFITMVQ